MRWPDIPLQYFMPDNFNFDSYLVDPVFNFVSVMQTAAKMIKQTMILRTLSTLGVAE